MNERVRIMIVNGIIGLFIGLELTAIVLTLVYMK